MITLSPGELKELASSSFIISTIADGELIMALGLFCVNALCYWVFIACFQSKTLEEEAEVQRYRDYKQKKLRFITLVKIEEDEEYAQDFQTHLRLKGPALVGPEFPSLLDISVERSPTDGNHDIKPLFSPIMSAIDLEWLMDVIPAEFLDPVLADRDSLTSKMSHAGESHKNLFVQLLEVKESIKWCKCQFKFMNLDIEGDVANMTRIRDDPEFATKLCQIVDALDEMDRPADKMNRSAARKINCAKAALNRLAPTTCFVNPNGTSSPHAIMISCTRDLADAKTSHDLFKKIVTELKLEKCDQLENDQPTVAARGGISEREQGKREDDHEERRRRNAEKRRRNEERQVKNETMRQDVKRATKSKKRGSMSSSTNSELHTVDTIRDGQNSNKTEPATKENSISSGKE